MKKITEERNDKSLVSFLKENAPKPQVPHELEKRIMDAIDQADAYQAADSSSPGIANKFMLRKGFFTKFHMGLLLAAGVASVIFYCFVKFEEQRRNREMATFLEAAWNNTLEVADTDLSTEFDLESK